MVAARTGRAGTEIEARRRMGSRPTTSPRWPSLKSGVRSTSTMQHLLLKICASSSAGFVRVWDTDHRPRAENSQSHAWSKPRPSRFSDAKFGYSADRGGDIHTSALLSAPRPQIQNAKQNGRMAEWQVPQARNLRVIISTWKKAPFGRQLQRA